MATPNNQKVSLGCGTLILIALIVLIFSGSGINRDLKREVSELKNAVANLQNEIKSLRWTIENQQRSKPPAPPNP
ncbi:MAG: hypothetical protein WCF18_16945 [Chthoniobacteraceae bacterium]